MDDVRKKIDEVGRASDAAREALFKFEEDILKAGGSPEGMLEWKRLRDAWEAYHPEMQRLLDAIPDASKDFFEVEEA